MASYRIGIGSFNLKDGNIGIGTETTGFGNLKVEGTIKTTDLNVGVSTFTRYAAFEAEQAKFGNNVDLSGEFSSTGDIVVDTDATLTVGLGSTACIGSVECISVKHHFSVPVGDNAQRDTSSGYQEGVVRYNRDLGTMEFFNGNEWRQFTYISDIQNSPSSRGRGVFFGGNPGTSFEIQFINLQSLGNAQFFGSLVEKRIWSGAHASSTRGIVHGGQSPSTTDSIEYVTIQSEGNAIDFGDMFSGAYGTAGCSSSTRGLIAGGNGSPHNGKIGYIQISTLGDSLEFGNLSAVRRYPLACSSPIRGFFTGGNSAPTTALRRQIDTVTISSLGDAIDFGDCTVNHAGAGAGCSNNVRGLFGGGYAGPHTKAIDYITMASFGDTTDFGDLSSARWQLSSCSSQTRGIWAGGGTPTNTNTIEFVTIASTGDTQDFGDLTRDAGVLSGCSDSHGGLGGY